MVIGSLEISSWFHPPAKVTRVPRYCQGSWHPVAKVTRVWSHPAEKVMPPGQENIWGSGRWGGSCSRFHSSQPCAHVQEGSWKILFSASTALETAEQPEWVALLLLSSTLLSSFPSTLPPPFTAWPSVNQMIALITWCIFDADKRPCFVLQILGLTQLFLLTTCVLQFCFIFAAIGFYRSRTLKCPTMSLSSRKKIVRRYANSSSCVRIHNCLEKT